METKKIFFEWNNTYNTGIAVIDVQHKVLVKILNELYDVVMVNNEEDKMDDVINELVQYTVYHFSEEEKIFKKFKYPEYESHKEIHQQFVDEINIVVKKKAKGEGMLAIELIGFLKDWLIEHILGEDQKYVVFFRENKITI